MKTLNKVIAVFLTLVVVSGFFPHWGFAQSMPEPTAGINRSLFDYHFSRADRELSPDRWLSEARRGIDLALNAWEVISLDMFDTPLERDEYRRLLEKWSEDELESRFTRWLSQRFFGTEADNLSRAFSGLTSETQLRYTYHLDAGGNLLHEETTGDPKVVRPADEGRDFSADLAAWREDSRRNISSLSEFFDDFTFAAYPQLLAFIPAEDREILGAAIGNAFASVSSALKLEFENIAAREERLFAARRTGDIYSLRKKSDEQEASYIAANLIEQAKTVCDAGVAALQTRIEEAANGEGDLVLMGTEWLEMYRRQFERGLKIWEEAEERFFIRRIEWEQDSLRLFENGEEAWVLAFNQFEEERQKWELQTKALFESGEALFRQASVNLEYAIAQARIEFENNLRLRTESGASKAKALVDMYFTCVSTEFAAKENAEYWVRQYDVRCTVDVTDGSIYAWIEAEKLNTWKKFEQILTSTPEYEADLKYLMIIERIVNQEPFGFIFQKHYDSELAAFNAKYALLKKIQDVIAGKYTENGKRILIEEIRTGGVLDVIVFEYFDEIAKSVDLYTAFHAKSTEQRAVLLNDYGNVFGSGAINDILSDISGECYIFDEYQIALARAKILAQYWERRLEIARAVDNYAAELGAGRLTEAESLLQWETAKAAYEASINAYEQEMEKLNGIGDEIHEKQKVLDAHIKNINRTSEELERLNDDYISFIIANSVQNDEILKNLNEKYSVLLFEYKLVMDKGDTPFYLRELELAIKIGFSQKYSGAKNVIEVLIHGSGDDMQSLAVLRENAGRISEIADDDPILGSAQDYGIASDNYRGGLINRLIQERNEKIQELSAVLPDLDDDVDEIEIMEINSEIEKITAYYNGIIRGLCSAARSEAKTLLAIRNMEIKLFSDSGSTDLRPAAAAYGSADWYCEAWNVTVSDEQRNAMGGRSFGQYLYDDYAGKYEEFITKRLHIEMEALQYFLTGDTLPGNYGESLASYCLIDRETAERVLQALHELSERIESNDYWIDDAGELDEIIVRFILGESYFLTSEAYFYRELNEYMYARGLYEAFCNYAPDSFFIEREEWEKLAEKLEDVFAGYMIPTGGLVLPDIAIIGRAMFVPGGDYVQRTASLLAELDQLFSFAPDWLLDELFEWKTALIRYITVHASSNGYKPDKPSDAYSLAGGNYDAFNSELNDFFNSVLSIDIKRVNEINDRYLAAVENESQLIYSQIAVLDYEYFCDNSGQDEKHWRMFLTSQFLKDQQLLSGVNNAGAGVRSDTNDWAGYFSLRINNALCLYLSGVNNIYYGNTLSLSFDHENEIKKNRDIMDNLEKLKTDFAYWGKIAEYSLVSHDDFLGGLASKRNEILALENAFQTQKVAYLNESKILSEIGRRYDSQYSAAKIAFNDMESLRNEYDKQDAIRRWASTAYLDAENNDLGYCSEKLNRANIVLDLLANFHNDSSSGGDSGYTQALAEYEKAYRELLLAAKAVNYLDIALSLENEKSDIIHNQYLAEIHNLGGSFYYPPDYAFPASREQWSIKDVITLKDGKLAFSADSSFKINQISQNNLDSLIEYFSDGKAKTGEYHEETDFQRAVGALGIRMAGYFDDIDKLTKWGLARDYLLRKLSGANGDIKFLSNIPLRADMLKPDSSLGSMSYMDSNTSGKKKIGSFIDDRQGEFHTSQENAWNSLSAAEKADLEFYVILMLDWQNDYSYGFSQFTVLAELQRAYNKVSGNYSVAKQASSVFLVGLLYIEMRDVNSETMNRIGASLNQANTKTRLWKNGIVANTGRLASYGEEYRESCRQISVLEGNAAGGKVEWLDIKKVLDVLNGIGGNEISVLETLWKEMGQKNGETYAKAVDALAGLVAWLSKKQEECRENLEIQWARLYLEQNSRETEYRRVMDAYMEGQADISDLVCAMEGAYGPGSVTWKSHHQNVGQVIMGTIADYRQYGPAFTKEFAPIAEEYAQMTALSYGMGLSAELAVREAEWNKQRFDIAEKFKAWQEMAAVIVERGREDWNDSYRRMIDSHARWIENFRDEYERVSSLWAQAYLSGLEDKEQWLAKAAEVADNAYSGAMLDAVGSEAERFSRAMDTRDFSGILPPDAANEAESVLAGLIGSAGITGMGAAFNAINNMGNLGAATVWRSFTNAGSWNAANARLEAAIISQEANKLIAERESKKLAINVRRTADQAVKMLAGNVNSANTNFRESMDDLFIMQGQWRRNGDMYVKDIIAGSTLFEPVITDQQRIPRYKNYEVGPIVLETRLDDEYLEGLEYFAIQNLIEKVYNEVNDMSQEIFGDGKSTAINKTGKDIKVTVIQTSSSDDSGGMDYPERIYEEIVVELPVRYMGSGKFGEHIGYEPSRRPDGGSTKNTLFYDQGAGELGRLLTEYIYWATIDAQGIAEVAMAPWEKRMWDDSGSDFSAPSLHSLTNIALSVATAVVSIAGSVFTGGMSAVGGIALIAAINSSGDLLYNSLDVICNYKSIDEAGVDFGKSLLINTASAAGTVVFGGISNAAISGVTGAVKTAAIQASIASVQTISTGLVSNAIGGITYSREGGFGYSADYFAAGMAGTMKNVFSSVTSTMVSGVFTEINSGSNLEKLGLHSLINKDNVQKLNAMTGELAGQGMYYLMGDDFALNLLNTSFLEFLGIKNGGGNSGLLELHIGQDGNAKMNFGTAGANISPDIAWAALQGAAVWGYDIVTDIYMAGQEYNVKNAFQASYSFGDSRQRAQMFRFIFGMDLLETNDDGDYNAKTTINENGKRVVTFTGYYDGMSLEDQAYLAVILGHEAYRDGYGVGDTDQYGNLVTNAGNFIELKGATIAHIDMADRLNSDYGWLYETFDDLHGESFLLGIARQTGQEYLFDTYVKTAYNNDEDYFWRSVITGGDLQNNPLFKDIPLLNGLSDEGIREANNSIIDAAVIRIMLQKAQDEGYEGEMENFVPKDGISAEDLREKLNDNKALQKQYNIKLNTYESLYRYGCMLFSLMYGVETITGSKQDPVQFNEYMRESGHYTGKDGTDLSTALMAKVMNELGGGLFEITLAFRQEKMDLETILQIKNDPNGYLGHIRVASPDTDTHSVMIQRVEYEYGAKGEIVGVLGVHVANPAEGNSSFNGKTFYTINEIERWDVFKVTYTQLYYRYQPGFSVRNIMTPDYYRK